MPRFITENDDSIVPPTPSLVFGQARAQASEKIRAFVEKCRDLRPAVASAVIADGRVVFSAAAGECAPGTPCTVDETVFLTASISKTVTAMCCLQAAERGELDLDADVGSYVGLVVRSPHFPESILTVRHLLQHRSGLRDSEAALLPGKWRTEQADCEVTLDQYIKARLLPGGDAFRTSLWIREAPPGKASYHYSNAGFALAGWVLEAATGRALSLLAKEHIFAPLGMTRSTFGVAATVAMTRRPLTSPDGAALVTPYPPGHDYGVAEYPAAGLRSTAGDLAKYLIALTAPAGDCPLLQPAALAQLLPDSFKGGLAWWGRDALYGVRDPRSEVWTHGGFMEGVRTHVYLWPRKRAAIVVLTNTESWTEDEWRMDGKAFGTANSTSFATALEQVMLASANATVAGPALVDSVPEAAEPVASHCAIV